MKGGQEELRMQEATANNQLGKQRMQKAKARKPPKATKPKSHLRETGNAEDAKSQSRKSCINPKSQTERNSKDQRIKRPKDQGTKGPRDQRRMKGPRPTEQRPKITKEGSRTGTKGPGDQDQATRKSNANQKNRIYKQQSEIVGSFFDC